MTKYKRFRKKALEQYDGVINRELYIIDFHKTYNQHITPNETFLNIANRLKNKFETLYTEEVYNNLKAVFKSEKLQLQSLLYGYVYNDDFTINFDKCREVMFEENFNQIFNS